MYQPKIRDDQVRQLYVLAKSTKKPMTKLIREAVDEFLAKKHGEEVKHNEDHTGACQTGVERGPGF
jgi:predicted transcriptional regulator